MSIRFAVNVRMWRLLFGGRRGRRRSRFRGRESNNVCGWRRESVIGLRGEVRARKEAEL